MIRFAPGPKPPGFVEKVEVLGAAWLLEHPTGRPKDLWTPFKAQLAEIFRGLCAYSVMYEPVGTVDHFVSCDEDRGRTYDWSNYRYASGWINSSKQNLRSSDVFDPFLVEDGWFEILLPSLQLVPTDAVPVALRAKADAVLRRLRLRDDERVLRQRREWYRMYQAGEITLEGLRRKAPLIALAVMKRDAPT